VAVLSQPQDASYAEGVSAVVRTVTDAGDGDTIETRYTLCALQNGVPVATSLSGPVPSDGILDLSLRQVTAGGSYVVRFNRLYGDGGSATALTQPFLVTVRQKTEAAGTYEGLLLDANPAGTLKDGAVARGWITVSVSRTGAISGRVQYVEAGSLGGAPSESLRTYQPVSRPFSGILSPASTDEPLTLVANPRLGVGSQAGRQELNLLLDRSGGVPLLTATLADKVSLPTPATSLSKAAEMRQALAATATLPQAYASVAGRYTLSAAPGASALFDNNAQLLVQVLASGRTLWTSRLTGYAGSGAASLTAPTGALLVAAVYEGRSTVGSTTLATNALLGELRFTRSLEGWDLALGNNRLENPRTKLSGSRQTTGFVTSYNASDFTSGAQFTEVRMLNFTDSLDYRVDSAWMGRLFGANQSGLSLISSDPLAGGSAGFRWNVTVSEAGVVRATGVTAGGASPPLLSLRLDRVRGEWSGSYVTGGVRRSLIGCVLDGPSARGRGWFETGNTAGRWELRLGP
jgi:hypothetical protein